MNIVLDTNVVVSGIFWGGYPGKILSAWSKEKLEILVSEEILDEYFRVISEFGEKTNREDLAESSCLALAQNTIFIQSLRKFNLCRDPDDDKFISCAVSGKAKFLITGDKDLLVLKNIMEVEMIKPRNFLNRFPF